GGLKKKEAAGGGPGGGGGGGARRGRSLPAAEQDQRRAIRPGRDAIQPFRSGHRAPDDQEVSGGVADLVAVEELPHRPRPERPPPVKLTGARRGGRGLEDRAAQRLPVGRRPDRWPGT